MGNVNVWVSVEGCGEWGDCVGELFRRGGSPAPSHGAAPPQTAYGLPPHWAPSLPHRTPDSLKCPSPPSPHKAHSSPSQKQQLSGAQCPLQPEPPVAWHGAALATSDMTLPVPLITGPAHRSTVWHGAMPSGSAGLLELSPGALRHSQGPDVMSSHVLPPAAVLLDPQCVGGESAWWDPAWHSPLVCLCSGPGGAALGHTASVQRCSSCVALARSGQAGQVHFP